MLVGDEFYKGGTNADQVEPAPEPRMGGVAYGAFAASLGQRHEGEEREAVWLSGGQQRQRLLDEVTWHVDRTARRPRWPESGAGVCK